MISNTHIHCLFRATCEQEPNYLQTFTSLSRWSQKAENQTASQYSILTVKALAHAVSVQNSAAVSQPNKNNPKQQQALGPTLQSQVGASQQGGRVHLQAQLPRRLRPAYTQGFQASLDNMARSLSQKHNTNLNFVHVMLPWFKLSKSVLQNSRATMM